MIIDPQNSQNTQMRSVKLNDSPIMRVILDNKQIYPNGIYAQTSLFPSNRSASINHRDVGILAPKINACPSSTDATIYNIGDHHLIGGTDFPTIAKNQTINGVSGYDIFRLYTPKSFGFGWVNPDASKSDMYIENNDIPYYDGYGTEFVYNRTSFIWPTGHNLLRLNSMVCRNVKANFNQPHPFYVFMWEHTGSIDYNLLSSSKITVPAASALEHFFEEKNTWFVGTAETLVTRYIALAVRNDWIYEACTLEMSFHFSYG
jgi:hypothetical protein